jgi:hypothetical protein
MVWKELSPGPRRYQATVSVGQSKFVQFAPTGESRSYFFNYIQRIRGAGVGAFPNFAFMPGVCLKSAYLPHLIFIGAEMSSCCLNNAYLAYTDLADARLTSSEPQERQSLRGRVAGCQTRWDRSDRLKPVLDELTSKSKRRGCPYSGTTNQHE